MTRGENTGNVDTSQQLLPLSTFSSDSRNPIACIYTSLLSWKTDEAWRCHHAMHKGLFRFARRTSKFESNGVSISGEH
jgi:hypothetical protein